MPCFIDKDQRICAVGYLIEKTAGRKVAEDINVKYKYDGIFAMNDELVNDWIAASGFSKEECAMIQPTYGTRPTLSANYISPAYGISSSILSGLNVSLTALNTIQISKLTNSKNVAVAGLVTGSGRVLLGAIQFPKATEDFTDIQPTKAGKSCPCLISASAQLLCS